MRDEPNRSIGRNTGASAYGRHGIRSSTPPPSRSDQHGAATSAPSGPAQVAGASSPLEPGDPRRIGSYELLTRLGIGGMGTVYLGRGDDDALVAIKLVHAHLAVDAEFRARFRSEVQAGKRVPAFCSARVLGSGDHERRPYLVTEYIDGIPLSQLVAEDGPLPLPNLHALALGTAAGLAAIHGADLVHRDVKPSNIVMTLGGVRIIDFGIARALDDTAEYTRSGVVMGSLGWAAPEQLGGESPSPAMDVFGWGCVVGFAATGDHPFGGTDLNTRAWRVLHEDPDISGVPDALRPLVESALNRRPEQRPTTRDLLLALVDAVGSDPVVAATPLRTGSRPRKTFGALAAAAPLALAIVIGAAGGTHLGDGLGTNGAPPEEQGSTVPFDPDRPSGQLPPNSPGAGTGEGSGAGGERPISERSGALRLPATGVTTTTVIVEPTTSPPASPAMEVTKRPKPSKSKSSSGTGDD